MIHWITQPETWEPGKRYFVQYRIGICQIVQATAFRRSKSKNAVTICQIDGSSKIDGKMVHCWELRQDGTSPRQYGIYPEGKKPSYRTGHQLPENLINDLLMEIGQLFQAGQKKHGCR